MFEYVYLGDRCTRAELKGARCTALRKPNGKRMWTFGKALVRFASGEIHAVLSRRLRKIP